MKAGVLNGRVAIGKQGISMPAARALLRSPLLKKYFIVPFVCISITFATVVYFSRSKSCSIVGFSDLIPHKKTYHAWSHTAACQKAWAMCTYYSNSPKECKVEPDP